jgi:predicted S18 family serine protease
LTERVFKASTIILALLLALSLAGNVYLAFVDRTGEIDAAQDPSGTAGTLDLSGSTDYGSATLQGPAVYQRIEVVRDGVMPTQRVATTGAMLTISVDVQPGQGRVLVQTKPLMGIVFQDAANTAVLVAQNRTGHNLADTDVIFSVEAAEDVPEVNGPSAGALMTALVIAALTDRTPHANVTLTGTIDPTGHVGAIGGVVEKARAAYESGKSTILLPRENAVLVQSTDTTRTVGRRTITQRSQTTVDAKEYIEREVGIAVVYVDSIGDVEKAIGLV